ncbi:MAG TPA: peptidylprolyl isomerase [Verrucomicrobiae bacterium]|nr:peptidylprolyl isomerase [Verrucomicrobiae bacterium]
MHLILALILGVVMNAWHSIDLANALVIDTTKGRIIVALEPRLAPHAVERVKRLARMHVYDGLLMWRVVDTPGFNFVQTGDPHNHDGDRSALPDLRAEFSANIPATQIRFVRTGLAPEGFLGVVPVGASYASGIPRVWGAYCDGVMGMGRERDVDSANAEIFFMRGTTRDFDHDYTVVGRILVGLDVIRAAAVGVPPKHPDRMLRVRVLSDLPSSDRPSVEVLDTSSAQFEQLVAAARRTHGADFSVCDISVPVKAYP